MDGVVDEVELSVGVVGEPEGVFELRADVCGEP